MEEGVKMGRPPQTPEAGRHSKHAPLRSIDGAPTSIPVGCVCIASAPSKPRAPNCKPASTWSTADSCDGACWRAKARRSPAGVKHNGRVCVVPWTLDHAPKPSIDRGHHSLGWLISLLHTLLHPPSTEGSARRPPPAGWAAQGIVESAKATTTQKLRPGLDIAPLLLGSHPMAGGAAAAGGVGGKGPRMRLAQTFGKMVVACPHQVGLLCGIDSFVLLLAACWPRGGILLALCVCSERNARRRPYILTSHPKTDPCLRRLHRSEARGGAGCGARGVRGGVQRRAGLLPEAAPGGARGQVMG